MRRVAMAFMACALLSIVSGQSAVPQATRVKVVMLGTGTPLPDPERSGPSIAVVVDNHAYLFDAGTGIVRRAAAATVQKGIAALEPRRLRVTFLTHLHSDHTLGLPLEIGRFDGWKTLEELGRNRKVAPVRHSETIEVSPPGISINEGRERSDV